MIHSCIICSVSGLSCRPCILYDAFLCYQVIHKERQSLPVWILLHESQYSWSTENNTSKFKDGMSDHYRVVNNQELFSLWATPIFTKSILDLEASNHLVANFGSLDCYWSSLHHKQIMVIDVWYAADWTSLIWFWWFAGWLCAGGETT